MQTSLQAMTVLALYLIVTAPFLVLLQQVHALRGEYTYWLIAGLVLQLIPIGLIFFPLGFIGLAILAFSLSDTARRLKLFRNGNYHNPAIEHRWSGEYMACLWAFGLALEQKGLALVFIQVSARQGLAGLWLGLLPVSILLWTWLFWLIMRERKQRSRFINS